MLPCRANLSQQELADLFELSVVQSANVERGKGFAQRSTIPALGDALGVKQNALSSMLRTRPL